MATLISLRRRIRASQNVSKTTRAMQMIAASKMKRAQEATLASRPYVTALSHLASEVAGKITSEQKHPYLQPVSMVNKTLVIALSPDKGLCGGLVTNLVREFLSIHDQNKNAEYIVIGKKLQGQAVKLTNEILATFNFGTTLPEFDTVFPLIKLINDQYLSGAVDSVKVLYTDFQSIFTQKPKIVSLLPITLHIETEKEEDEEPYTLFEPNLESLLPDLLTHYIEMSLYQFLLESFVSEQASRMIAMQNATDNAKDIISELTLEYNKTRQERITSELLDISSSKAALAHDR